jgi:hypothetical protein
MGLSNSYLNSLFCHDLNTEQTLLVYFIQFYYDTV